MKNIPVQRPICGLVLVLLLAGCSGSNDVLDGSRGRPVAGEVTAALQLVVFPTVERLVAFSPINQPAPPRSVVSDPAATKCVGFDPLCRSGRFEVCQAAAQAPVVFRYERCDRSSVMLDGAWELTRNGLRASAVFDLGLDELALAGRVRYVLNDMCWRKEFESFRAARGAYSATIDGGVGYCFTTGAGDGQLQVSVSGPSEPFEMLLEFDSRSGTAVVSRDGVTTICRFELDDGVADCEAD